MYRTLGCVLSHRIRRVFPPLAPHVEHLWTARGFLPRHWRNLILPDGTMELIVNLGDPQTLCALDNPERRTIFQRSWISGERIEPLLINEAGYVHLVGVRLRPGGGWPFLGIPMREFSGRVIDLEDVLGPEMNELRDRLGEETTDDARFDLLEGWLLRRQQTPATRAVTYALREIQRGADAMRIGRLAEEIGISHKHFLREFDRCVGLTPKKFSRLCAFQRVIQSVGHRTESNGQTRRRNAGITIQAHMIHEFRAFSGLTPASYLAKRGPFLTTSKFNRRSAQKCQFSTIARIMPRLRSAHEIPLHLRAPVFEHDDVCWRAGARSPCDVANIKPDCVPNKAWVRGEAARFSRRKEGENSRAIHVVAEWTGHSNQHSICGRRQGKAISGGTLCQRP